MWAALAQRKELYLFPIFMMPLLTFLFLAFVGVGNAILRRLPPPNPRVESDPPTPTEPTAGGEEEVEGEEQPHEAAGMATPSDYGMPDGFSVGQCDQVGEPCSFNMEGSLFVPVWPLFWFPVQSWPSLYEQYVEEDESDPTASSSHETGGQEATENILVVHEDGIMKMQLLSEKLLEQLLDKDSQGYKAHKRPIHLTIDGRNICVFVGWGSICAHYILGTCRRGEGCRFLHVPKNDVVNALKEFLGLVTSSEDLTEIEDTNIAQEEAGVPQQEIGAAAEEMSPEEASSSSTASGCDAHGEDKQSAEAGEASGFAG